MLNKEFIELINQEIDGENSIEESTRLKTYLAQNSEASAYYEDQAKLSEILARIENVDPPTNLKKNILNSLSSQRYAKRETRNIWQTVLQVLNKKFNHRYALAFSAGLAVGLLVFVLVNNLGKSIRLNVNDLTGTILLRDVSDKLKAIDQLEFQGESSRASLMLKSANDLVLIESQVESDSPIELLFEFDQEDLSFVGVRQSDDSAHFVIQIGRITLTHDGSNQYWIVFRKRGSVATTVRFRIIKNSVLLFEKNLSFENPAD